MRISKKDRDAIYQIVFEEIMDARVKIKQHLEFTKYSDHVDDVLYKTGVQVDNKLDKVLNKESQ